MALDPITPLKREQYQSLVGDVIAFAVKYVDDHGGWLKLLSKYNYGGDDWKSGVRQRFRFNEELMTSIPREDCLFVASVNRIMAWGGMKPFAPADAGAIRLSLKTLDQITAGRSERWKTGLFPRRVAAITKVYEMYNPLQWTIYDSRVSFNLERIVNAYTKARPEVDVAPYIRFPWAPGRGEHQAPVDGFPQISAGLQTQLATIYGSWFLSGLANRLADLDFGQPTRVLLDDGTYSEETWGLYHVEMALFMFAG